MKKQQAIDGYKNCKEHVYSLAAQGGAHSFEYLRQKSPRYTIWQVRRATKDLLAAGRFVTDGHRPKRYASAGVKAVVKDAVQMPVLNFKPLRRDPFEMWRLCERAPYDPVRDVVVLVR